MKHYRLVLLLVFLMVSPRFCDAQIDDAESLPNDTRIEYPVEYEWVLKTNPLSIIWGSIPLTAEYMALLEFVTSPQQATQIGLSYISKSPILKAFEDTIQDLKLITASGVRLQLSHRFYILKWYDFAPMGFYIAPQFSYATVKISTKHFNSRDVYIRVTHASGNVLLGWQYRYSEDFTLDFFVGGGYKDNIWQEHLAQSTINLDNDAFGDYYSGNVKITVGFHVGIAF